MDRRIGEMRDVEGEYYTVNVVGGFIFILIERGLMDGGVVSLK